MKGREKSRTEKEKEKGKEIICVNGQWIASSCAIAVSCQKSNDEDNGPSA